MIFGPAKILIGRALPIFLAIVLSSRALSQEQIPLVDIKSVDRTIVIELRDRHPTGPETETAAPGSVGSDERSDLLSALSNLGYQRAAAEKAVDRVLTRGGDSAFEVLLREVLKELAR